MGQNKENTVPASQIEQTAIKDQQHVWHHLIQHKPFEETPPMMVVSGEGLRIKTDTGQEYLDAVSGAVWTVNVGYGRERIAKAVYEQTKTMNFFSGCMGNIPAAEYSQMITDVMPGLDRVYYSTSGSEANEKGYKIVRQLAHQKSGGKEHGKKHKILYRDRDYHGTTITTLSSTGHDQRKDHYGPFTPGFVQVPSCCCYRCPFDKKYGECEINCAKAVEEIILKEDPETVGSIVLEPITAGGGVITPPKEYFPMIAEICKRYDVLLHIDEVVCGLGRTGTWFGYQHYGITPDIVTMAKGVASGYAAISCTVTSEAIFNEFKKSPDDPMSFFRDISTYGGCTAGPAAAIENMKIIKEEKLLDNVVSMGNYALDSLNELKERHSIVGDVRGKGLFLGIELVKDRISKEPVHESIAAAIGADCMQQGVIIGRTNRSFAELNNTLCLAPALIATKDDIDEIINAIDNALGRVS